MNALTSISVGQAQLPRSYETARTAIAECAQIDECKDWADKAEALASYARQAEDDQLLKMAKRIKSRALRRVGELLKQIEPGHGARDGKREVGDRLPLRSDTARAAGLSPHQQKQSMRIANVPEEEFEALVESVDPPTTSALAERGTRKRTDHLGGRTPEQFNTALHFTALVERYAAALAGYDLSETLPCLNDDERLRLKAAIGRVDAAHDQIATRILT